MERERKRILLVEDEVIVAMTIEDSLLNMGYEVIGTVDNGLSAIEMTEREKPDLILMDIRINGDMDGIEAVEEIKKKADIPVIFLTAHSDEATISRVLKTNPYGFLVKPFREKELYANIETAINRHRLLIKNSGDRKE